MNLAMPSDNSRSLYPDARTKPMNNIMIDSGWYAYVYAYACGGGGGPKGEDHDGEGEREEAAAPLLFPQPFLLPRIP